jgi:hypothetical protein
MCTVYYIHMYLHIVCIVNRLPKLIPGLALQVSGWPEASVDFTAFSSCIAWIYILEASLQKYLRTPANLGTCSGQASASSLKLECRGMHICKAATQAHLGAIPTYIFTTWCKRHCQTLGVTRNQGIKRTSMTSRSNEQKEGPRPGHLNVEKFCCALAITQEAFLGQSFAPRKGGNCAHKRLVISRC